VHRLAAALTDDARAHGARVVLGTRVSSADAAGVRLHDGEHIAGRVVFAAPGVATAAARTRTIVVAIAVVDAPDLDRAPRGTGALVEAGAEGIAARAFTHSSAKWPWLAKELPTGRHVVRLSYDGMPEDPEKTVLADLRAITGARIDALVGLDVRTWTRTLESQSVPGDQDAVGEAASITGLASIVGTARETARAIEERITTDVRAARPGGAEG
jgi:oxygen-dependent protoporphyrinogen oxidase